MAVLAAEVFLDKLTTDPTGLLYDLNQFLATLRSDEPALTSTKEFKPDELRRMAFFMATGSGKTLLLHVNVWQALHYLEHGRYPEALVRRADGRRLFDNVLLITPSDGLSGQHIAELRASGQEAGLFIEDPQAKGGLFGARVSVIEIQKLADEPSKDGVSVVLTELGSRNLVIVDEGHKGTGSEAKAWKTKQQKLSADGFLLEYSATFSQAIGAASARLREDLLSEYGKAILFDYSYAHFYGDGYGKDFCVLNISKSKHARRASQAHELMLAGLLTFYSQLDLYRKHDAHYRAFNIEPPLWVLLGTSVSRKKGDKSASAQQERTDIAEVIAFLRRFLEDPEWSQAATERILSGEGGFHDGKTGADLSATYTAELRDRSPSALYKAILRDVFHGSGALEAWEIASAEGEVGLRVSTPTGGESPYFGVVNIGDVPDFRKHLKERLALEIQDDRLAGSLFKVVDQRDSPVNMLIGAKKFIEGWSSWRVSSMGLMNVGMGEGSQVMQLFGRGVRLKGKGMSLKRTDAIGGSSEEDRELNRKLESLYIFGWNADYLMEFGKMLENEDLGREFPLFVVPATPWPKMSLPVPRPKPGFSPAALTWQLEPGITAVTLDLLPRVSALASSEKSAENEAPVHTGEGADAVSVHFGSEPYASTIDVESLFLDAVVRKQEMDAGNVYVTRATLRDVLRRSCQAIMTAEDSRDPALLQRTAREAVRKYVDKYCRAMTREALFANSELDWLAKDSPAITTRYTVRVRKGEFLNKIEKLLKKPLPQGNDEEPLPRLHWDRHLFNPILTEGSSRWAKDVSVQPPALSKGERKLLEDLRKFWRDNRDKEPFAGYEVFVLRNLPVSGIGLFSRSGFYPDFVVWLKHRKTSAIHVRFLDPHGLHHDGFSGSADKFAALAKLKELSAARSFSKRLISLDGFVVTDTELRYVPDRDGRDWPQIEREFPVVRQADDYSRRLLLVPTA